MKTKLLGTKGTVPAAVLSALLYHLFKWAAFIGLYTLFLFVIIPSLALYSTELGDKLYVGYEVIKPAVSAAAMAISYIAASFVCAGFNYRFRKKIRKHFFSETFGMIGYKEGIAWFNTNYGILDRVFIAAFSLIISVILSIKMPVLALFIFLGFPADCIGGYVSLRKGLTFLRIHSITCD